MPIAVMMEFEREHHVDDDDLEDHPEERAGAALPLAWPVRGFHLGMNLVGRLRDQEQPAADQDDVAPREGHAAHAEDRLGQADQPHQQAEQEDAENEREREPDLPRALRLRLGNASDDNRQEDDVVDAEHDLERRQRQQRRPCFRTGQEFDHDLSDRNSRNAPSLATT